MPPTAKRSAEADPPGHAAALFQRALELHRLGQLTQAKQIYEQVLTAQPLHFDALHLSGVVAAQLNNPNLAAALIGKAIEVNPVNAAAYSNLGIALKELGRMEDALANYDRAIAIQADYAEAYYNRGNVLRDLHRLGNAVANYDRAIALKPDYVEAYTNRGLALQALGRLEDALASYEQAIVIAPNYAKAYSNRGNALRELRRLEEALASYDRSIVLKPDYAEAYANRGVALKELKRIEEALASYDQAIYLKPDYVQAYTNRGNASRESKRIDEALASYDRAIAIEPGYAEAYWNKSIALLLAGDLPRGWKLYEWRWKRTTFTSPSRNFSQPLWLGEEGLADKTILLHAEQGLGDTIQFCRYAKLVKTLGAHVVLEVPKALLGLLSGMQGFDDLIEKGKPLPAFDYHCPLMSLPLAFQTSLSNIPSPGSYLASTHQKRIEWAKRLAPNGKRRIGLAWSGSSIHQNDHNRSLTLKELLPYLPAAYEYVSLQKEVREVDKPVLAGSGIGHHEEDLKDFSDTAALCDLVDMVISVDTSVAHLAGAMGKTTYVLLPYSPDWRWLLDRRDSPWYDAMTLYRQDETKQWPSVLERLRSDLLANAA